MRRNARTIFILVCLAVIGCFGCFIIWDHYKDNVENDNTCEFTRTYKLLLITPIENSDDFYVTLQNKEGVQTVLVSDEEKIELEEGQIYEFVFRKGNSIIEDTIQSIFDNTDLVEIRKTDHSLENGLNEAICS